MVVGPRMSNVCGSAAARGDPVGSCGSLSLTKLDVIILVVTVIFLHRFSLGHHKISLVLLLE